MAKRFFSYILMFITIVGSTFVPGSAHSDSVISITATPQTISVNPGQIFEVTVDITMGNISRGTLYNVKWDQRLLKALNVSPGQFYSDWATEHGASLSHVTEDRIDNTNGVVWPSGILIEGSDVGPSGSGTLLTITMQALTGVSGISDITINAWNLPPLGSSDPSEMAVIKSTITVGDLNESSITPVESVTNEQQALHIIPPALPPGPWVPNQTGPYIADPTDPESPYYDPDWGNKPRDTLWLTTSSDNITMYSTNEDYHWYWGTDFYNVFPTYGWSADQYVCDMNYLQDMDDHLYAPTMKGSNGCPLEVTTAYERGSMQLRIYDFTVPAWTNVCLPIDSGFRQKYVRNDYYKVLIWKDYDDKWSVLLWDYSVSAWSDRFYSQSASAPEGKESGWDFFETWNLDYPFWPRVERIQSKNISLLTEEGN